MIDLITMLLLALIIAIVVNAINLITSNGMIFGFIQDAIEAEAKSISLKKGYDYVDEYKYYFKPLVLCPPCMCSIWGSIIFFSLSISLDLFIYDYSLLIIWIVTILTASYIAYKIHD